MKVKEIKVGQKGVETKFELAGEEIKLTQLDKPEELSLAHASISAIVCEEFFELADMLAEQEGKRLCDFFESEEQLDKLFKRYLSNFTETLVQTAIVHARANYKLFERQRESGEEKNIIA